MPETHDVAPPLNEGRYRLLRELGAGGMARVYLAWDERLGVHRAIKVLDPAYAASPSIRRRFENEARTMARLHHPNVVAVHDVGEDGGRSFIVMEVVDGGSLVDRVKKHGPLAPRTATEVLGDVLAALSAAHAQGVVHRDVKPHNVLLARGGAVKVADFGIAHVPDDVSHTRTGAVMGTLPYMAPEQRTDAKSVGPAADVYAAGATLYAVVTGKEPHDLWSVEIQEAALADVAPPVAEIVRKACRYRAEDRYASAAEMRGAILDAAQRLPAAPVGAPPLVPEPGRTPAPVPLRDSHTLDAASYDANELSEPPTERATPATIGTATATVVSKPRVSRVAGIALVAASGVAVLALVAVLAALSTFSEPADPPPPPAPAPAEPAPLATPPEVAADPAPLDVKPVEKPVVKPKPAPIPADEPVAAPVVEAAASVAAPAVEEKEKGEERDEEGVVVRLWVNTRPAGSVKVDGSDSTGTPLDRKLPVGPHRVELSRTDGSDAVTRTFDLQPGADVRFCWDFEADAPCPR